MSEVAICGVIGDPVAHSKSPAMHNAAFAALGIAARYERWHTPAADLAARVDSLRRPGMLGANVTLPHKLAVVPLLDALDPLAEQVGAVNTIVRTSGGMLVGYNTDVPATAATLAEDAGFDVAGRRAVILGASGAARAAAFALAQGGVRQIAVVNRTIERAEELLGDVLAATDRDDIRLFFFAPDADELRELLGESDLLINATSLGWRGDETPLPDVLLRPGGLVFDMVYRQTRLLRDAAAAGYTTLDGVGMLVRQAGLAFSRWTGQEAPLAVMRAACVAGDA